jgi:nicotinamide mononucleotide transporter
MDFLALSNIAFEIFGYSLSYLELIGTLFGALSVYWASKTNILTWPSGIVNEFCLFFLFYQVQLYADMLLQVYFFVVTLYGWRYWKKEPAKHPIKRLSAPARVYISLLIVFSSLTCGYFFSQLHLYMPTYFTKAAAYPYVDALVMVLSIVATILLAQKKIETWYLWILVDLICTVLFFKKKIIFLAIEYFLFLGLASYGLFNWKKNQSENE